MAMHLITPGADILLVLSVGEARSLLVLAEEGAEALSVDPHISSVWRGPPANQQSAKRAMQAIQAALVDSKAPSGNLKARLDQPDDEADTAP